MASLLGGQESGSRVMRVQSLDPSHDPAATTAISVQSGTGSGAQGGSAAMNTSSSSISLSPASIQGVSSSAVAAELSHVLSGLQQSGELTTVLQQQPHLVEELSVMASGEVSADPESLRFQYPLDDPPSAKATGSKKTLRTVYREQDRFLPINNVSRVMRNAIPKTGKVSKDAKECMQECVSEFISFITSEAVDRCAQEKRKTVTGDDILYAMATLGFDNYIEPMKLYLQKIREYAKSEKMNTALANNRGREMVSATLGSPPELQAIQSPASVASQYQPMQ